MELLHSQADGIVRPEPRRRRTFLRVSLVLLAAVAAAGFGARAAQADPTVQLTLDQTSIPNHGSVTLMMTVSSLLAYPSGRVSFVNAAVPGTPLATVDVTPTGAKSSIAKTGSLTFSSPPTSYALYAVYIPDTTAFFLGLAQTQSATQTLTVAETPAKAATGVSLSSSSLDVDTTTPVTLTATVAKLAPGGPIPTGTVSFSDVSSGTSVPLGTRALVAGSAQLVVSTFAAGEHDLVASYSGSDTDRASSSDPPLVLNAHPPADPRLTTTSLVTLLPPTIALGDTVTIVATIAQSASSSTSTPPGGQVTFSSTSDLGQDVILGHAGLGTVPDGSGLTPHPDQAVIQVSTWERAADYAITASYIGDIFFKGSASPPVTLSVLPRGTVQVETHLVYTGATSADYHDVAHLSATLLDDENHPVSGEPVVLSLGTQTCPATTAADGSASCDPVVDQPPGSYLAGASFAAHGVYAATVTSAPFTVTREETSISIAVLLGPGTSTLVATLLEDGATPIAGRAVALSLGDVSCPATVTTNGDGIASCTLPTPTGALSAPATASFGGDLYYFDATRTVTVALQSIQTQLEYTGPASADYDDDVTLTAMLDDTTGTPVVDGTAVSFALGSQQCDATTVAGVASCDLTIAQPAGDYTVTTTFVGQGALLPSSVQSSFTVEHEESVASLTVSGNVLATAGLTLTGTLLEDGATAVANRTLTLSIGGLSCDAVTDATGVASCSPAGVLTLGPTTSTATFAGDDFYVPAVAAAPAVLYALAPGGGSFAIGDRDATVNNAVTFWGSQWWKLNTLSRTSAPSSFKGFAAHPASPACGTSWSTDPGNSTPPPAGPLPAYMAVIATSASSTSGSTISGTTAHVVIVKTTPGYDANPGHSGTGTVVAIIC
jgi:hypothetical protein